MYANILKPEVKCKRAGAVAGANSGFQIRHLLRAGESGDRSVGSYEIK